MDTIKHIRMLFSPNADKVVEIEIKETKKHEFDQNTGQAIKPPSKFEVIKFSENLIMRLKFTSNRDSLPYDSNKEQVGIINSFPRILNWVPLEVSVDHPDHNPTAWFDHIYGRLRLSGIDKDVVQKVESALESYIKENPKPARLVVTLNHVEVYEDVKMACMPCKHVVRGNCMPMLEMTRRSCPLCRIELCQQSDEAEIHSSVTVEENCVACS